MKAIIPILVFFTFISISICKGQQNSNLSESSDKKLKEGQIWKYKTRPGEENSTITILKIERITGENGRPVTIVFVQINGLKIRDIYRPDVQVDHIQPYPFHMKTLLNSLTQLVSENNKIPDFEATYNKWRGGKGAYLVVNIIKVINDFELNSVK